MTNRRNPIETALRRPALAATLGALPIALLVGVVVYAATPRTQDAPPADYGPVSVRPISGSEQTAVRCRALTAKLPNELLGRSRPVRASDGNETEPVAEYAAAWSDPAIVLRCGVDKPRALTPSA
ncbi:MAG: DUF3515 family protein, partial [Pseudonocardiaceae bacterium]